MESGKVETTINNNIAEVSFFHPKGNSLNSIILKELAITFKALSVNAEIKVIVLRSNGDGAFCGGASISEMLTIKDYKSAENYFNCFSDLLQSMISCPKFILARVHGKVVGGGIGLISACDYVIASLTSEVRLSELAIGIGPFVISPAVAKRIGNSAFKSLTINYDWHTANWALSKSLFDEICKTRSELDEAINQLAQKMTLGNSEAIVEMKKIFWNDSEQIFVQLKERAHLSAKLLLSEFTQNHLKKYLK
ncbi:MAG: enoyl-CoA hydratase [Ignavibacteriales bacterium CG_4_9_14_3_um_filter_34_10]|nr:enoyl-CoA hydratase/isomerase family protein [Paraglaciecola sp.]PJA96127.1 MAG: enoyl-CoA hydratase [Ignavibacteriales bacterium CG_4_9_14_3_um_filter_34_10]